MPSTEKISLRSAVDDIHVKPPPYPYNPSRWSQRIPIVILASIGAVTSVYLALYQWRLVDTIWDPLFGDGSTTVLDSEPSQRMHHWFGIPDAALGAIAYLGDAIFGLAGSTRRWQYRPWMVILFGLDVIPLGVVSIILVVVQGTVVGAWCTPCLVTALISLILIVLAYDEVWVTIKYLVRVWRRTKSMRLLWDTFIGRYVPEADAVAIATPAAGPEAGGTR